MYKDIRFIFLADIFPFGFSFLLLCFLSFLLFLFFVLLGNNVSKFCVACNKFTIRIDSFSSWCLLSCCFWCVVFVMQIIFICMFLWCEHVDLDLFYAQMRHHPSKRRFLQKVGGKRLHFKESLTRFFKSLRRRILFLQHCLK